MLMVFCRITSVNTGCDRGGARVPPPTCGTPPRMVHARPRCGGVDISSSSHTVAEIPFPSVLSLRSADQCARDGRSRRHRFSVSDPSRRSLGFDGRDAIENTRRRRSLEPAN